jgi:hypothetical protein
MMEEIMKIIKLRDNEEILEIIRSDGDVKIRDTHLDKEYHNIDGLPPSYFHIEDDFITFKPSHVFTNMR